MMPRRLLVLLLAIVPVSASAQPAGATTDYSTLFSRIMVELSTAIVLVSDEVETVADADAAESVVIATMQQTTKDLRYLLANLDGLVGNDPRGPREPSIIMLDSAVASS